MTNFTDFNVLLDNLVLFFTGSYAILAVLLSAILLLVLLVRGFDFRYATAFTLPLLGAFVGIGWFGDVESAQWIVNLGLVVLAFFYGAALLKFSN